MSGLDVGEAWILDIDLDCSGHQLTLQYDSTWNVRSRVSPEIFLGGTRGSHSLWNVGRYGKQDSTALRFHCTQGRAGPWLGWEGGKHTHSAQAGQPSKNETRQHTTAGGDLGNIEDFNF